MILSLRWILSPCHIFNTSFNIRVVTCPRFEATTPGMETVSQSLGENIEKQLIEYTPCAFSLGKLGVLFGLWSFYFVGGLIGIYMVPPLQMAFFSGSRLLSPKNWSIQCQDRFEVGLLFLVGILCIHLCTHLRIHLCIHLCIHLSTYRPMDLFIHLSIDPSIYLSIHLSVCLSIYLSTYLPIYLSTYLAI